jgi:hypothetical protein
MIRRYLAVLRPADTSAEKSAAKISKNIATDWSFLYP